MSRSISAVRRSSWGSGSSSSIFATIQRLAPRSRTAPGENVSCSFTARTFPGAGWPAKEEVVKRVPYLSTVSVLAVALGLGQMVGCGEETDQSASAQTQAQKEKEARKKNVAACHLDDGSI